MFEFDSNIEYYDYYCLALLVTIEPFVIRNYDLKKSTHLWFMRFLWHFMSSMYLVPCWYRIFLLQKGPHCLLFYSNYINLHILYIDLIQVLIFYLSMVTCKKCIFGCIVFSLDRLVNEYISNPISNTNQFLNYEIIWRRKKTFLMPIF